MARRGRSKSSFRSGDAGADDAASDIAAMAEGLRRAATVQELSARLGETALRLGFHYYALVHHADIARPPARFIFVQNYPQDWVEAYARAGLHRSDPAQRLASVRPASFAWQDLPQLTALSSAERALMGKARCAGLGEGFTVPLHAPGERAASCSFATIADEPFPGNALLAVELLAHVAFSTLFDLLHAGRRSLAPRLTARQEECVVLMSQGKTDWEIATILGLSEETVTAYLKAARQRFGVSRRTQLALAAVSHGLIGFDEIVSWQHPPKGR